MRAGSWLSLFGTADSPGGGVGAWNCWCGGEAPLRGRCGLASGVGVQRFARDVGVVGPTQPIPAACSARASPKPVGPGLEGHPRRARQRGAELDDLTRLARQPERTHLPPTRCPSPRRSPSGRARPTTRQRAYLRPPPRRGSGSCRSQRCGAGRRTRSLPRKPCTQTGRRTAPGSTSRPSTARQPPSRPVCRRP